jgi:hypothetical protein
MTQPGRVKMPATVLAMRLEPATAGIASNLFPKTTPKKPHGIALIKTT